MADHNGDYSPEAEYKRKQKREKVQRSRLRKKIDEGRASNAEIMAMNAWDEGAYTWDEIAQAMTGATRAPGAPVSAPSRAPRATRSPRGKSAGKSPRAATREPEAETEEGGSWPAWASWASVAAFVGACIWYGIRSV